MDKISKFLRKLTTKEQTMVSAVIEELLAGNTANLDIKKLRGFDDIYRVRIQTLRIIYSQKGGLIKIIEISRRSEKTYKDF